MAPDSEWSSVRHGLCQSRHYIPVIELFIVRWDETISVYFSMFSCRPPPADNEWPFYDALPFVYKAKCHCHLRFICFAQHKTGPSNLIFPSIWSRQVNYTHCPIPIVFPRCGERVRKCCDTSEGHGRKVQLWVNSSPKMTVNRYYQSNRFTAIFCSHTWRIHETHSLSPSA